MPSDCDGYFRAFWTILTSMSLVLGYMDDGDCVLAADGRACGTPEDEYALKTIRVTPTIVLACTGETKFMRPLLSALGFSGVENSEDIRMFWDIECSGHPRSMSYDQAWNTVNRIVSPMAKNYAGDKDGFAVCLIGKKGKLHRRVTVWGERNKWRPGEPDGISATDGGRMFLGYLPPGATDDEVWRKVSDRSEGATLEERLAKAIRWCAGLQSGPERRINGNVFTRRMSEGFTLRWSLDPSKEHNWQGPDQQGWPSSADPTVSSAT